MSVSIKGFPASTQVVVHPLVLLSVVDHYSRACKGTKNRAVGVLLGSWKGNLLDVANSFAVPFEEDSKNPEVYFLDHDYLEQMFAMFRKVNAKERIIGWYHTGPKLRQGDININEVLRRFVAKPLLVIVDVAPKEIGIPIAAYVAVEEVHDDGTPTSNTFEHLPSEVGAEEAEEVGVEHLLRDIKDIGAGTSLTDKVQTQLSSLKGLNGCIADLHEYVGLVVAKKLPINHDISYLLQNCLNKLPDMDASEFVTAMTVKTSDQLLVMYLSSLVRATISLHNLISNKIENKQAEKLKDQGDAKKIKSKDAAAAKTGAMKEESGANKEETKADKK